jgi:small subunit ribosomal protein S8
MSMSDPLGDMLTRIRNALHRGKATVRTPASKLRGNVLEVLVREGYIRGYTRIDQGAGKADFDIELKYHEGQPVIREISRVSRPGRRVYSSVKEMPQVRNGLGISIISTPSGVMSDSSARDHNVGGEVLCKIF